MSALAGETAAVVTGATSFLGAETVRALLGAGYRVCAVVRPGSDNLSRLPAHPMLTVAAYTLDALGDAPLPAASLWYHFAWGATKTAERNDEAAQRQNVEYALSALENAAKRGCKRFVFPGSQAEYGIHKERITEETPCSPVSAYGKAKLAFGEAGDQLAASLGTEFCHLRIFSVYGAGDHPFTLVSSAVAAFLQGEDMRFGPATQNWNFLNIRDFGSLMVAVARAEYAGGVYNVASLDTRPLRAFIEELHTLCGGAGRCRYGERAEKPEGAVSLDPDIQKTMEAFAWTPQTTFAAGIREMIEKEQAE